MNDKIDEQMTNLENKINALKEKQKALKKKKKADEKLKKEKLISDIGKEFFNIGFTSLDLITKHKEQLKSILSSKISSAESNKSNSNNKQQHKNN